ncbi:hypothetical protein CRG98_006024 [Punica granatum]|uniref:Uncharacterized protein n=1 Tax=Punica granatum TaxID=22663 RepID=A0A2I0L0D8_PUNGR|nr:hypothetical protein CRG98_006024 [Punica granatum]
MGHANETRTRTGCPFLSTDRGVSVSLTPRISADHEMTVMPLGANIENLLSLSCRGVLPNLGTRGKSRRSGKGSPETRLERTDPNRCSRIDWQTRLAVWLVGAVPVDRDGIFARGQFRWIPKRLRIVPVVVSGGYHA